MNRFSITFNSHNPMACPSCACVIDDRNLRFWGDIAFCHECCNRLDYDQLHHLAEIICEHVDSHHLTSCRGLVLFTPAEYLRIPLQPALIAGHEILFRTPSGPLQILQEPAHA